MSTVADVIAVLERHYPTRTAEPWDKVGLVAGDPDQPVSKVLLTVDITSAVLDEAVAVGADMVVAHHPPLLRGVHAVDTRDPKGRLVWRAARAGIALYAAHTNADIPDDGVCAALCRAIGLVDVGPLDERHREDALDQLVTFVPVADTGAVVDALAAAGAGAFGDYERCHFTVEGTGSFRPLEGANPTIGSVGDVERVTENRLEMVLPRSRRDAVVAALRAAHPYEEPAFHVVELARTGADASIGRIGRVPEPMSADDLAQRVADVVPDTVTGVRLGGDPDRRVERVAVLAGAGDSHLDQVRRSGVDAYITSDLRHHPATEALEHADSPVLIDVAHWAAEWTWLPVLDQILADELGGVERHLSTLRTDAWTVRFD
ncbi:Nif3-like dinuclear metal center hexameric protein [Mariniluteicoccus endophyticus]